MYSGTELTFVCTEYELENNSHGSVTCHIKANKITVISSAIGGFKLKVCIWIFYYSLAYLKVLRCYRKTYAFTKFWRWQKLTKTQLPSFIACVRYVHVLMQHIITLIISVTENVIFQDTRWPKWILRDCIFSHFQLGQGGYLLAIPNLSSSHWWCSASHTILFIIVSFDR